LNPGPGSSLCAFWNETVQAVHARRVIPIHWDDFTRPLDQPMLPTRLLFDDMDKSMEFLRERGRENKVELRMALPWQTVDPFLGLDQ
jgi:L-ascorbate metabolism protein UlaG (beta-lactamase superfamily)